MEEILSEDLRIERFEDALRKIRERQLQDLDSGVSRDRVALSEQDFQDLTGGGGEFVEHLFHEAFQSFRKTWLEADTFQDSKGLLETKYLPKN